MGTAAGEVKVVWEAEISRRGVPPPEFVETRAFETPIAYRIPPFSVRVYGPAAMAGAKVNALLSPNRSVPRDIYDLAELVRQGASPVELWAQHISREALESKRTTLMLKIDGIDFALANAELLPYIAPDLRRSIDESKWDEIRLKVAHHVEQWMDDAISRAQPTSESGHDRNTDIDLAGR